MDTPCRWYSICGWQSTAVSVDPNSDSSVKVRTARWTSNVQKAYILFSVFLKDVSSSKCVVCNGCDCILGVLQCHVVGNDDVESEMLRHTTHAGLRQVCLSRTVCNKFDQKTGHAFAGKGCPSRRAAKGVYISKPRQTTVLIRIMALSTCHICEDCEIPQVGKLTVTSTNSSKEGSSII